MTEGPENDSLADAVRCPICKRVSAPIHPENRAAIWDYGRVFENYSCANCELIFCHPMPSDDEIRDIYTKRYDYEWFRRRALLKRAQAIHRFQRLQQLWGEFGGDGRPRFIDIGCGHGWLVGCAQNAGWISTGIDFLDDDQVRLARCKGLDLRDSSIERFVAPSEGYEFASMWHSLEHTSDPRRILKAVGNLLGVNGLAVIAVPNRNAAGLAKAGSKWGWFQKPFIHPWCFSVRALKQLLPDNLRLELVSSRDTWDQQWVQYSSVFQGTDSLMKWVFRWVCGALRRVGLNRMAGLADAGHFVLREGLLVMTYLGYLIVRRTPWIRDGYERQCRASELLIVARRV
ncbi:MAG: class I SAM-dependent methyltransferase [Verrucomicrobiales bacterium]|nr:class I SAM-dependent methyltransferase [Verrucomicrobiales bacterium]